LRLSREVRPKRGSELRKFHRIPPKCRFRARSAFGPVFEAEPGGIAAEALCLQNACLQPMEGLMISRERRPVTPEVAGSSSVAPVKYLQIGIFCCQASAQTTAGLFSSRAHPARDFPGNHRSKPLVPGDPRNRMIGRTSRRSSGRERRGGGLQALPPRRQQPGEHPVHIPRRLSPCPARAPARGRRAEATSTLALDGRLLSQRELDGLVPRHRASFVRGSVGSRLAEPGTGRGEVALAPGLG